MRTTLKFSLVTQKEELPSMTFFPLNVRFFYIQKISHYLNGENYVQPKQLAIASIRIRKLKGEIQVQYGQTLAPSRFLKKNNNNLSVF